jgi:signal transduction histidine kinase
MAEDLLNAIKTRLKKVNDYNAQYDSLIKNISMYIPHELRTPLVAIMGYSQLLISDVELMEKNEIKEMMERILWSAHRLHSRIEKFIAYSDLDLAWSQIETNPNNLVSSIENDLVADIILGHYFLNKRAPFIKLQIEPEYLKVPKVQLVYLLKELLENAVKYSEMDSEIIVLGEKQPAGYCITVKDCGIGMDKKEIDNIGIFKQFSRDIYSQDGNGLGLAICKKIVQMNNGQISFESEKGKSTTVKVTLPI